MEIFKFMVPEIIFGRGTLNLVGESASRLGATRIFLVTDEGVKKSGWVDEAVKHLNDIGLEYQVWAEPTENPKDFEIDHGKELYLETGCDAVVGLGGGSANDAAKAVAVLATNGGKIHDYEGVDKIEKPLPPLLCVATTAGAAAEVTQFVMAISSTSGLKAKALMNGITPLRNRGSPPVSLNLLIPNCRATSAARKISSIRRISSRGLDVIPSGGMQ
jgi:alcohol dehydrogenase class IV